MHYDTSYQKDLALIRFKAFNDKLKANDSEAIKELALLFEQADNFTVSYQHLPYRLSSEDFFFLFRDRKHLSLRLICSSIDLYLSKQRKNN